MPTNKNQEIKLPSLPGLDLSDSKTRSRAQAVATRKNNDFRRAVERKAPLFRTQILADYEEVTPEIVIERRAKFRAEYAVRKRERNAMVRGFIRRTRAEVMELTADRDEFFFIMRIVTRMTGGDRHSRWSRALMLVKRRRQPLSATADLVLAWLTQETKPVTQFDLWERRGDGLQPDEILKAFIELSNVAAISRVALVELPERFHKTGMWNSKTAWTFEAMKFNG